MIRFGFSYSSMIRFDLFFLSDLWYSTFWNMLALSVKVGDSAIESMGRDPLALSVSSSKSHSSAVLQLLLWSSVRPESHSPW
ncbi:hypothetical protein JTE90_004988 [Oedothorax gibbosus]|uniref:Uncharacterized protein n=1 Tax=Oedothorax gibbosus TaxID=931172 RepID=A0AAV6VIE8_9ARAC|nr:hypothetical protein JTE90_004988 [Oedothorax gibbosus]